MLLDGITFTDSSTAVNLTITNGPVLPTTELSTKGELFFQDDVGLFCYTGAEWVQLDKKLVNKFDTKSFFPGAIAPMEGTVRWYPGQARTLTSVFATVSTAPTTNITIDIKKNGVSIYGAASKPTIIAGSNTSAMLPISVEMTSADYLTIDILTGDGSDLAVRIEYI